MNDHAVERCRLPWTLWRRLNSVWSCPMCGRIWAVRLVGDHGIKTWELIDRGNR